MTIHQIECFLEAAKTLNFTEAASRLYISQQGLSRQIASLEKELELRLFDRTTRDVRPNQKRRTAALEVEGYSCGNQGFRGYGQGRRRAGKKQD